MLPYTFVDSVCICALHLTTDKSENVYIQKYKHDFFTVMIIMKIY